MSNQRSRRRGRRTGEGPAAVSAQSCNSLRGAPGRLAPAAQRASVAMHLGAAMPVHSALGRKRNRTKFRKWGFYFHGDGDGRNNTETTNRLRDHVSTTTGRAKGGPN